MIRGMKKKLLIGLLTAAVVGSSLAPSVPYSVEFTQEVKAETDETDENSGSGTGQESSQQEDGAPAQASSTAVDVLTKVNRPDGIKIDSRQYNEEEGTLVIKYSVEDGYKLVDALSATNGVAATGQVTINNLSSEPTEVTLTGSTRLVKKTIDFIKEAGAKDATFTVDNKVLDAKNKTATITVKAGTGRTFTAAPALKSSSTEVEIGAGNLSEDATSATYDVTYKPTSSSEDETVSMTCNTVTYADVYNLKLNDDQLVGATAKLSTTTAKKGDPVKVTITPIKGYTFTTAPTANGETATKVGDNYEVNLDTSSNFTDGDNDIVVAGAGKSVSNHIENVENKNGVKKQITTTVTNTTNVSTDVDAIYNAIKVAGEIKSETNAIKNATADSLAIDVEVKDATSSQAFANVSEPQYNKGFVFSVTIKKTVDDGQPVDITDLDGNLVPFTITLPTSIQGKKDYLIYADHNGSLKKMTKSASDGEYYTINSDGTITVYLSQFSEFAVYASKQAAGGASTTDDNTTPATDDNTTPATDDSTTPATADDTTPGSTPTVTPGTGATTAKADEAKKAPAAPTAPAAKKLSAKTGSPKTADYAVNSLLALLTGAAGLFGISLMNSKKRKDEDQ